MWPGLPEYARIVLPVQNGPGAQVGSSWYFVRCRDREQGELYRLTRARRCSAPRIDPVDCGWLGIEGSDLDLSVDGPREYAERRGLYRISDRVHMLSALLGAG